MVEFSKCKMSLCCRCTDVQGKADLLVLVFFVNQSRIDSGLHLCSIPLLYFKGGKKNCCSKNSKIVIRSLELSFVVCAENRLVVRVQYLE